MNRNNESKTYSNKEKNTTSSKNSSSNVFANETKEETRQSRVQHSVESDRVVMSVADALALDVAVEAASASKKGRRDRSASNIGSDDATVARPVVEIEISTSTKVNNSSPRSTSRSSNQQRIDVVDGVPNNNDSTVSSAEATAAAAAATFAKVTTAAESKTYANQESFGFNNFGVRSNAVESKVGTRSKRSTRSKQISGPPRVHTPDLLLQKLEKRKSTPNGRKQLGPINVPG